MVTSVIFAAGMLLSVAASPAAAHGEEAHGSKSVKAMPKEQTAWGIAGDVDDIVQTIEIRMADTMRFTPDRLKVRVGETVRFVMFNEGKLMHELVIGTKQDLDEHAALMMKFPGMEHDEPYMAHVPPGETGEIVWTFNRPGRFDFACLVAGHYQSGMRGTIVVASK